MTLDGAEHTEGIAARQSTQQRLALFVGRVLDGIVEANPRADLGGAAFPVVADRELHRLEGLATSFVPRTTS